MSVETCGEICLEIILNFLYARTLNTPSHLGNANTTEGIINFEISKHPS